MITLYGKLTIFSIAVHSITCFVHVLGMSLMFKTRRSRYRNSRPILLHLSMVVVLYTITNIVLQLYLYMNPTKRQSWSKKEGICTSHFIHRSNSLSLTLQFVYLLLILILTISQMTAVITPLNYPYLCSRPRFRKASAFIWLIAIIICTLLTALYSKKALYTATIVFLTLLAIVYVFMVFVYWNVYKMIQERRRLLKTRPIPLHTALATAGTPRRVSPQPNTQGPNSCEGNSSVCENHEIRPGCNQTTNTIQHQPRLFNQPNTRQSVGYQSTSATMETRNPQGDNIEDRQVSRSSVYPLTRTQRNLMKISICIFLIFTFFYLLPTIVYVVINRQFTILPYISGVCYTPALSTGFLLDGIFYIYLEPDIKRLFKRRISSGADQ